MSVARDGNHWVIEEGEVEESGETCKRFQDRPLRELIIMKVEYHKMFEGGQGSRGGKADQFIMREIKLTEISESW